MISRSTGQLSVLSVAALLALLVVKCGDVYDGFVEGDDDPSFLRAGRHAGEWEFDGDERELAAFAGAAWHRIRFDLAPASGAEASLVVGGEPQPFSIGGEPEFFTTNTSGDTWIVFQRPLPGVTPRANDRRLELTLEAKTSASNDRLYVGLVDSGGRRRYFAYSRL